MWPQVVALIDPAACYLPDLIEVSEQMQVRDLVTVGPVKVLKVSILVRLARLYELECDAVFTTPVSQRLADELRTVIEAQNVW